MTSSAPTRRGMAGANATVRVQAIERPFRRFRQQPAASGEQHRGRHNSSAVIRAAAGVELIAAGILRGGRRTRRLIGSRSTVVTTRLALATSCRASAIRLPTSLRVCWLKLRSPGWTSCKRALQLLVGVPEVLRRPCRNRRSPWSAGADAVRPGIAALDAAERASRPPRVAAFALSASSAISSLRSASPAVKTRRFSRLSPSAWRFFSSSSSAEPLGRVVQLFQQLRAGRRDAGQRRGRRADHRIALPRASSGGASCVPPRSGQTRRRSTGCFATSRRRPS